MRIKRKNGLKIAAITIALLLCLALAVGITGAWYQAQRQATGTLSMDQGIIIDYKGFDQIPDEGIWSRETTTTFLLFDETNAQPGEEIAVNPAGIRANENSVNFYARVKLTYKFYNVSGETETEVTLANISDLITTSANFFGTNWVDGGSTDGYYYYATGSTLNKFEKGAAATTPFVNLFADGAYFEIEDEEFKGEGGGFVVGDTSINKIEVYLTLETLQGDADAAAEGWKIASQVKFSEATERMETSVGKTETTEDLNVSVNNGEEVAINDVVFNYDSDTTLKFDSNNVEYISLTYSDGSTETFDVENYEVAENTFKVNAKSSKGTVTGYTVGIWSSSEYTGFLYSKNTIYRYPTNNDIITKPMESGICLTGYVGNDTEITIPSSVRVRERDFKLTLLDYSNKDEWSEMMYSNVFTLKYPCVLNGTTTLNSIKDLSDLINSTNSMTDAEFIAAYPKMEFEFKTLCETSSKLYSEKDVKEIDDGAFQGKTSLLSVTISNSIELIDEGAFLECSNLKTVNFGTGVKIIKYNAFNYCENLNMTLGDLDGTWVYAEDGTELINGEWVEVKEGEAVDWKIELNDRRIDIKRA